MGKKVSLQEQLERMKYVAKYAINETPKYKSLVSNSEFDTLPEYLMREADGTSGNTVTPDASMPTIPSPDAAQVDNGTNPQPAPSAATVQNASGAPSNPETDTNVEISTVAPEEQMPVDQAIQPEPIAPAPSPEKMVMQMELEAIKKMSAKIEDIGSVVDSLNQRLEIFSDEVEKVREPSDMEKFDNRKNDSSPYYFNLNDMWDKDTFRSRMDQFSKGMVKTEDGYVADFDDLPKLAAHEVKASFDEF
jgi:hypothetical protein